MYVAAPLYIPLLSISLFSFQSGSNPLSYPGQDIFAQSQSQKYLPCDLFGSINSTARDLLYALDVMQDDYFQIWQGTWPSGNDWTRAVLGTHVSATLSTLSAAMAVGQGQNDGRDFENLVSHFFGQLSVFYFGENAVSLRSQAYDDMQWVLLDWLENIKFQTLHSDLHYGSSRSTDIGLYSRYWHGMQFRVPTAHRTRLFYDLASVGWDTSLCGGGMIWSPHLVPYKNAITNELYVSSSIGMYLYFPGDVVESPFLKAGNYGAYTYPHRLADMQAAMEAYSWLKNSNMTGVGGLYGDGFHISGWESDARPGTRDCDVFNPMVYTYNQGVILSGLRGLWLATMSQKYLHDAHDLMDKVIRATGWPHTSSDIWAGLGRGGVLEDACDSSASCSQDGQAFKGIFFHHLAELCRPLSPQELRFLESRWTAEVHRDWRFVFQWHESRCRLYRPWIEHNAHAALVTRNEEGQFGMWWGRPFRSKDSVWLSSSPLASGAVDYRNHMTNTTQAGQRVPRSGDLNDRGRGRTVETQSGGVAVLRALYQWETSPSLSKRADIENGDGSADNSS